jgi:hypothetical protein
VENRQLISSIKQGQKRSIYCRCSIVEMLGEAPPLDQVPNEVGAAIGGAAEAMNERQADPFEAGKRSRLSNQRQKLGLTSIGRQQL